MPPKRKATNVTAATVSKARRTLHSFAGVSKGGVAVATKSVVDTQPQPTKKRKLSSSSTPPRPAERPQIIQDGDEDVIVQPPKRLRVVQDGDEDVALAPRRPRLETTTPKKLKSTLKKPKPTPESTSRKTQSSTLDSYFLKSDLPPTLQSLQSAHSALLTALHLFSTQHPSGVYPTLTQVRPHIERLTRHPFTLPLLRQLATLSTPAISLISYPDNSLRIQFNISNIERERVSFLQRLQSWPQDDPIPEAEISKHEHAETIRTVLNAKAIGFFKDLKKSKPLLEVSKKPILEGRPEERGKSLLERIRAKAADKVKPLSEEERIRAIAECRAKEVADVLKGLRAKGESVGLKRMIEVVKESCKNPIAPKEAEMAVRIVAEKEEWCNVVAAGKVEAVVFKKEAKRSFV